MDRYKFRVILELVRYFQGVRLFEIQLNEYAPPYSTKEVFAENSNFNSTGRYFNNFDINCGKNNN